MHGPWHLSGHPARVGENNAPVLLYVVSPSSSSYQKQEREKSALDFIYCIAVRVAYASNPPCLFICSCIIPLTIRWFVERHNGRDLVINGYSNWCPQWDEAFNDSSNFMVLTVEGFFESDEEITTRRSSRLFLVLALVFTGLDVAWILATWGAATMGTPTQPMGRDEYLRCVRRM